MAGRVFNPIVWAEFRRWRARPVLYLGMVAVALGGICYLHFNKGGAVPWLIRIGLLPGSINPANAWLQYLELMIQLVVRPSTLLPLMMVWRALVSFRDGGLYRPFRTTFLTPGEFLWGIIAVPFLAGALILVGYTGLVLSPRLIQYHFQLTPDLRQVHPYWQILAILFEGSLNGVLICFVALYFGLRGRARLVALVPVLVGVLLIQSGHAVLFLGAGSVQEWLARPATSWAAFAQRFPDALAKLLVWYDDAGAQELDRSLRGAIPYIRALWTYVVSGAPKLALSLLLWWRCTRLLSGGEE
ncbi:MAG: hypothetical protein PWP23_837 [Candidatus Sumerlaeota bacterium]|nr:hypothetical protein [Candidatus Sumerlaeota bacterium]